MATPPAAMSSWNLARRREGTPPLALPSLVADLMNRLRSVSGPMRSGLNAGEAAGRGSAISRLPTGRAHGSAAAAGAAAHRCDLGGAEVVLEGLHGNGSLHVSHSRQRQDAVVGNLDDVLERVEEPDREDVEATKHDDHAADLSHGRDLLAHRPQFPMLGADADQHYARGAGEGHVRDGGKADGPTLLHAVDTAADRALGDAELRGDLAVADARIHGQEVYDAAVERVQHGQRVAHVICARSKSYLITSAAIPAESEPMPRILATSRSRKVSSSLRSCSATRISMSRAPVTTCTANTSSSAASSWATSSAGRP